MTRLRLGVQGLLGARLACGAGVGMRARAWCAARQQRLGHAMARGLVEWALGERAWLA